MAINMEGIEEHRKFQTEEARRKVDVAITELSIQSKLINFNSISKCSGVSKSFLYKDKKTCEKIEQFRQRDINKDINQRAKYDKTSISKDVIIKAKDKRITKLEEENRKLKDENERLRGKLYTMS